MAQPTPTFLDELLSAARGSFALLRGDRQASIYFDFSTRGLVGSFIAVLFAISLSVYGGMLTGEVMRPGLASQLALINILGCGLQAGCAYLVLRQMGRLDGFVPYMVTSNWVALATAIGLTLTSLAGGLGSILLFGVAIGGLIILINIFRLIVTLRPMQIVIFVALEALVVMFGLGILGALFLDPQLLAPGPAA